MAGLDVFVSYDQADRAWVRVLVENLAREGLRLFFDEWDIVPGQNRVLRVDEAISSAAVGLVVVSPAAMSSGWVNAEYAAMMNRLVGDGTQRVVPVLLADAALPPLLAARRPVDFRDVHDPEMYDVRVAELVAAVREVAPLRPSPVGGGVAPAGLPFRVEGARTAVLRVGWRTASLTTSGRTADGRHGGLDWSAVAVLRDLAECRGRRPTATRSVAGDASPDPMDAALRAVGRMLGARFLPRAVAKMLADAVRDAVRAGCPLRLAVEVGAEETVGAADAALAAFADLPWETLTLPGEQRPLALHPNVEMHRVVGGLGTTSVTGIRGPLRVLVVIASPERGGGELLDYERELASILDAVDGARRRGAVHVRILNWGTRASIRAALRQERFHVLHISCHAEPGALVLEGDDGDADVVDANFFAEQVLVPGRGVPLVVLAGCSTALAARAAPTPPNGAAADVPAAGTGEGGRAGSGGEHRDPEVPADVRAEGLLPGLARGLLEHGVPAVLAMTAPVTDVYATELAARLYAELAERAVPEPLAALADARRALETVRASLPDSERKAALTEWATPALFLRAPSIPLYDPSAPAENVVEQPEPSLAEGITVRKRGEFVGRRAELRALLRLLRGRNPSACSSVVVFGMSGAGKSALAAELVAGLGEEAGLVVSLTGKITVEEVLHAVGSRLWHWCVARGVDAADIRHRLVDLLRSGQVPWRERLALVAEQLLPRLPVTLLLDNAEGNLVADGAGHRFADEQLAAFVAAWAALPSPARMIVTSRYPLPVSADTGRRPPQLSLGPLSPAETRKLLWRLPALDELPPERRDRAVACVGGHPRAMAYLDALLRGGRSPFPDVAARLARAMRSHDDAWAAPSAPHDDLDRAIALALKVAVDDAGLDGLLAQLAGVPDAMRLLVGACVYQRPVDLYALAMQLATVVGPATGEPGSAGPEQDTDGRRRLSGADPETLGAAAVLHTLGLLAPASHTTDPALTSATVTVHNWVAGVVLARADPATVLDAHRRAAAYWWWRAHRRQDRLDIAADLIHAGHHHLAAGDHDALPSTTLAACEMFEAAGCWDLVDEVCRDTVAQLPAASTVAAAFVHQLGIVARRRGEYTLAEEHYRRAAAVFEEAGDQTGGALAAAELGCIAHLRGDYSRAREHLDQAAAVFTATDDRRNAANVMYQLGIIAWETGHYARAEEHYRRAATLDDEVDPRTEGSIAHDNRGNLAYTQGDYARAEEHYQRAVAACLEIGDTARAAGPLCNLAMVAFRQGQLERAEDYYRRVVAVCTSVGDRVAAANALSGLAGLAHLQHDLPRAEELCRQAAAILAETDDRGSAACVTHNLGILAQARGEYGLAEECYRQAAAARSDLGHRGAAAQSVHALADLARERGEFTLAEEHYRDAIGVFTEIGDRAGAAVVTHNLGLLAQDQGDYGLAEKHFRQAVTAFTAVGDQNHSAVAVHNLGDLALFRGELAQAEMHYRQALSTFNQIGNRTNAADSLSRLGTVLTMRERFADAVPYTVRALGIRMEIRTPKVVVDLHYLGRQRDMLGDQALRSLLAEHMDSESMDHVLKMTDEWYDGHEVPLDMPQSTPVETARWRAQARTAIRFFPVGD